jgi:CO/xanthine dehydrogenase Mo-binding subunit
MAEQSAAAKILDLKPEQVIVHTLFLGGGFGRRANPTSDSVSEAVHVAKESGEFITLKANTTIINGVNAPGNCRDLTLR